MKESSRVKRVGLLLPETIYIVLLRFFDKENTKKKTAETKRRPVHGGTCWQWAS
jgi:hypothetical protein